MQVKLDTADALRRLFGLLRSDVSPLSPSFTRLAIGAAMDAYDEHRKTGEHSEIFGALDHHGVYG